MEDDFNGQTAEQDEDSVPPKKKKLRRYLGPNHMKNVFKDLEKFMSYFENVSVPNMFIQVLFFALTVHCFAKEQPGPKLIDETTRWSECKLANQTIYDFQVETLQGEFTDLSQYKGQVLLIINVATFCAYTQQYIDFNPLIEKNAANGEKFTILAFPCNQFYLQEPAENHEIMNGITKVRPGNGWQPHRNLHIYGKVEVNGVNQHPLYEFLKDNCPQTVAVIGKSNELMYNPIRVSDITWNFEKILVDKHGRPRFRFHPTAWSHGDVVQPFVEQLMKED